MTVLVSARELAYKIKNWSLKKKKSKEITLEELKKKYPRYRYALVIRNTKTPLFICECQGVALEKREEEFIQSGRILEIVDLWYEV